MKLSLGPHTGWSCSFDENNASYIWVGGSAGVVMLFDIRKMGGRVISPICPYDGACLAAYQFIPSQATSLKDTHELIPNLIPILSAHGSSSLNVTYPPIQSLVHSSSRTSDLSFNHLMICQGGNSRFVHIANQLSSVTSSFVTLQDGIPSSVYDAQRWNHPQSGQSCNYVLACRSHLLSGQKRNQLPYPALRSISFDPVKQASDSLSPNWMRSHSWKFDECSTITGHTLGTSGARPHSCFVGFNFINSLLQSKEDDTSAYDSGLMVACPNEEHQSVQVSVIAGNKTHRIDV